jgi:GT2 family glycosyltransferase
VNVSVIVPTILANPGMLTACVEGVIETTGHKPAVIEGGTFAENCNKGADEADGDLLLFLNDDCQVLTGWLDALVEAFNSPTVGIAGSKLVYPDGRIQHAGVGFRDNGGLEAYNLLEDLPTRDVNAVTGACFAIRADLFTDIGGFDETFRNGYEDVDLCLRVLLAEWRIRYVAESVVIHHESQSGAARWAHVRDNIALLQERWA